MIPFEEVEREYVDREEMIRSVGAFLYALLGSGKLTSFDAEAAVNLVEQLNKEGQAELFLSPKVLFYARGLADRLLVPLCDHEGPHETGEWPASAH